MNRLLAQIVLILMAIGLVYSMSPSPRAVSSKPL